MHTSASARHLQAPAAASLENPHKFHGCHMALSTRAGLWVPLVEAPTAIKTHLTLGPHPPSPGAGALGVTGSSNHLPDVMVWTLKRGGPGWMPPGPGTSPMVSPGESFTCQRRDDQKPLSKPQQGRHRRGPGSFLHLCVGRKVRHVPLFIFAYKSCPLHTHTGSHV